MSLSELDIKKEYRNLQCDVIKDFYIPILRKAIVYKRAVGFFCSSALYEIATGIEQLIFNGGHISLIVSPKLNEEDIAAIQLGYKKREEIVSDAILREFEIPQKKSQILKLNLLSELIANNRLDIKVAFKADGSEVGIFHEKIGLVGDTDGNKIAFTGSMNETYSGLLLNYESIDVYCSWKDEDAERVIIKEAAFDSLWNNADEALTVIDFPKVAVDKLNSYRQLSINEIYERDHLIEIEEKGFKFFEKPDKVNFFNYQLEAIENWQRQKFKGIFDMATGTGKTYTALGALCQLTKVCKGKLAVVIVCPYQHLVEQWVEDINLFGVTPLICYSRYDWKKKLKRLVEAYNLEVEDNFCIITTNATFILKDMQNELLKLSGNACLVVDEAHNFGSKRQIACMSEVFNYRLALSATLERHHDEYGTRKLYEYFGDKCIEYSLKRAIEEDKLTPYYYYPIPISLMHDELGYYIELTDKVVNILRKSGPSASMDDMPESAKRILIERARIIAGAQNKLCALKEAIAPYKISKHLLVYCGATNVDTLNNDDTDEITASETRQIDEVTRILGKELGMTVSQFTSKEDSRARETIKSKYLEEKIQALVAIKCLDEGMNIPGIETAFILASSTNPKEYIQRRGRVLRKAPNKQFAKIYDFITLPRSLDEDSPPYAVQAELSLINREVERMNDFKVLSENPSDTTKLVNKIIEKYNLYYLGEDYGRI